MVKKLQTSLDFLLKNPISFDLITFSILIFLKILVSCDNINLEKRKKEIFIYTVVYL